MERTKLLRRALWVNVAFAELGALTAIFLSGKWAPIDEMTNGQGLAFGIELFILAGLATYAAWKPTLSKPLVWGIVSLNSLLLLFLLARLELTPSLSTAGMELMIIEALAVLALIVVQIIGIRAYTTQTNVGFAS